MGQRNPSQRKVWSNRCSGKSLSSSRSFAFILPGIFRSLAGYCWRYITLLFWQSMHRFMLRWTNIIEVCNVLKYIESIIAENKEQLSHLAQGENYAEIKLARAWTPCLPFHSLCRTSTLLFVTLSTCCAPTWSFPDEQLIAPFIFATTWAGRRGVDSEMKQNKIAADLMLHEHTGHDSDTSQRFCPFNFIS
jgi:hypothetical protein